MRKCRTATRSGTRLFTAAVTIGLLGLVGCSSGNVAAPAPSASPAPVTTPPSNQILSAAVYNSADGYNIRPPADWIMHATGGQDGISILFSAPEVDKAAQKPFADNLTVAIQSTTQSLDGLIAETKQKYPSYLANYKVVTDQSIATGDGRPAHLLGGTYDVEGTGSLENIQLTVAANGKAYTVTFTSPAASFESYHEQIQAVLASFSLS